MEMFSASANSLVLAIDACLNSLLWEQCDQENTGYFQSLKRSLLSNNESEKCSAFKWKPRSIMYD